MPNNYEPVIGLEVHAQLLTKTKIFCGCSTEFGNEPNTNVCPICLGHPGVMPVLNKTAVEFAIKMGLATNCTINPKSVFARKNYFYPDLPKGYQISQYEEPICLNGKLKIKDDNKTEKIIGITRIHLEEDAGKLIHEQGNSSLLDANRCGIPLIEIVSQPDIRSAEEAYLYLTKLKQILQYLEICDGNMEEGSLRCDANVSVRKKGDKNFGTKTEIKNLNSFRNVERAINFEIQRQIEMISDGKQIVQETLLWDANKNEAISMRSKEEAHDYRYFPEPDLVPVFVDDEWKNNILNSLPELPDAKSSRFISKFNIPEYDALVLTSQKDVAEYFERVCDFTEDFKSASNWIMVDVLKILNEQKINITEFSVSPENLADLINLINDNTISNKIAKDVFKLMIDERKDPKTIVRQHNLSQITNEDELEKIINRILLKNENQVESYLNGKEKIFGFFIGQIMKETSGKANPQIVNELLRSKLDDYRKKKNQ